MSQQSSGPDGLVIVDKPAGYTSHDVVATMRGIARTRKVGHAGTLDPMATGVLVLGLGKATRLLTHLTLAEKEYLATIRLGQTTVSDDADGEITASDGAAQVAREALDAGVARLTGDILQVPAKVSAVKVDGKRSYRRVLDGEEVDLPARPVTVSAFTVHDVRPATADDGTAVTDVVVTVACSSGTYVRALARDLGADLNTGGHLRALRRTRVGPYGLATAHTLDRLRQGLELLPLADAAAAAFPRWDLDERKAALLGNGVRVPTPPLPAGPVAAFAPDGRLIALLTAEDGKARLLAVLSTAGN